MDELQQLREENVWLKRENQELRERVVAAEARIKQLVELGLWVTNSPYEAT